MELPNTHAHAYEDTHTTHKKEQVGKIETKNETGEKGGWVSEERKKREKEQIEKEGRGKGKKRQGGGGGEMGGGR